MHSFGFRPDKLRCARKELDLSQVDLAKAIGADPVTVSRWERGQSAPRGKILETLAQELKVEPQWFFEAETTAPEPRSMPVSGFLQELESASRLLQLITATDNPLDQDRALYDRQLAELQQVTPKALRGARDFLALSVADVARMSSLSSARITEIESTLGEPAQPGEIMALRRSLGVQFDPRASAGSALSMQPTKDRRPARARLEESRRLWEAECKRTPNKLDVILARLAQLQRDVDELKRKVERQ